MRHLASRLAAARANPEALSRKDESELLIAIGPHLEDFLAPPVRHRVRGARARGSSSRAGAALRREAPLRAAQGDERTQGGRRGDLRRRGVASRGRRAARRAVHRDCLRDGGDALAAGRGGKRGPAGRRGALRCVGIAHGGRASGAQERRIVSRAAQARSPETRSTRIDARERRRCVEASRRPSAQARGVRPDRPRDGHGRSAWRSALLHLVSRAGKGFLRAWPAGKEACRRQRAGNSFPQESIRRRAGRLPAGREDLRIPEASRARLASRCARDHVRRQSVGRRHRSSDLQRLHEELHLPEDRPGRCAAVGNANSEGRAGAALGLRNLQPADALESAQRAPAAAAARLRQACPCRRHGACGVHARAPFA